MADNFNMILQAIDKINNKLDAIKDELTEVQRDGAVQQAMDARLESQIIPKLEKDSLEIQVKFHNYASEIEKRLQKLETELAESRTKERILVWGGNLLLTGVAGWIFTHLK